MAQLRPVYSSLGKGQSSVADKWEWEGPKPRSHHLRLRLGDVKDGTQLRN